MHARIRSLAAILLAVVGLTAFGVSPAAAATPGVYLSLGDSVPFGTRGPLTLPPPDYTNAASFVGFPDYVASDLGLKLVNASCPAVTSAAFIDPSAPDNGCENVAGVEPGYKDLFPLHVPTYAGSQLSYAVDVLRTTPNVRLVTIMLGANDALLCQRLTPPCLDPATVSGIAAHVAQNLGFILRELRSTGYSGRIVAVTYYSLNYADPLLTGDTGILDSAIAAAATANGARVASGFLAFLGPSLRAGGDPVAANLVLANDDHPTPTGHRLLARTVEQAMGL